MLKSSHVILAAVFGGALATSANAEIRDFILEWSEAEFRSGATATGHISIDDGVFINPGRNNFEINPGWVTAFDITVSGSIAGDGSWTLADYTDIVLNTDIDEVPRGLSALDLTKELVGQPTSIDPWGTPSEGNGGDFNIFTESDRPAPDIGGDDPTRGIAPVPYGSWYFTITVGDFGGDDTRIDTAQQLVLTSFRPIPAPGALTVSAMGLGLIARRRRRL